MSSASALPRPRDYGYLLRIEGDAEFLERAYRDILGRAPDPGGQAFFLGRLREGARRAEIIGIMRGSEEHRALAARTPYADADGDMNAVYDRQTAAIIRRALRPDDSAVDVGCHDGAILDQVLERAPDATHIGFEPLPDLFARLRRKYAARPNVRLYDIALSDAAGETTFQHVVSNPSYSGILRRRFDRPDEEVVEIKVRLARLDDLLPADLPVRLLKVDVEGAELNVLRGAAETLRRHRPLVVFEHGQGSAEFYGTRPEHVFDYLNAAGMRISVPGDWLESEGRLTLTREQFLEQFELVTNYYFIAHP